MGTSTTEIIRSTKAKDNMKQNTFAKLLAAGAAGALALGTALAQETMGLQFAGPTSIRNAASLSYSDINYAVNGGGPDSNGVTFDGKALDGSKVILPAGSVTWASTEHLQITNLITLEGAGMLNTTITSAYSYKGSPPTLRGVINFTLTTSVDARTDYTWGLKGFTIGFAGTEGYAVYLQGGSTGTPNPVLGQSAGLRITDFQIIDSVGISGEPITSFHDIIGLVDHSVLNSHDDSHQWADVYNENWNGHKNSHGSYMDPVQYGGSNFLVFEDCLVLFGGLDSHDGGRYVVRHCRLMNGARVTDHGTESHAHGVRAQEVYQNWYSDMPAAAAENRSGTCIMHDNIQVPATGQTNFFHRRLVNHRSRIIKNNGSPNGNNLHWSRTPAEYGSPVDQNTELEIPSALPSATNEPTNGNVSPDIATGTATAAMVAGSTIFTDGNANGGLGWTVNLWLTANADGSGSGNAGYSYTLVNTDNDKMSSALIKSNTATTLTCDVNSGGGNDPAINFTVGQHYAIRKTFAAQDQPGMGVIEMSDADADSASTIANKNVVTGTCITGNLNSPAGVKFIGWQNQKLDPSYGWNNWSGPDFGEGRELKFKTEQGQIILGRDFFNTQKPAPGYGSTNGGLVDETYSPGYPIISSPTTAQKQVGAKDITGQNNADTLYQYSIDDVSGLVYPHPYVGIAATNRASTANTTNGTAYVSDPFTPTANALIVVCSAAAKPNSSDPNVTTVTDSAGLTWTQIYEFYYVTTGTNRARLSIYAAQAPSSPSLMTVISSYAGGTVAGCIQQIFEVTGSDVANGVGQTFVQKVPTTANASGTSASATLAAPGNSNNRSFFVSVHWANDGTIPAASWTELGDAGHPNPNQSAETEWRSDTFDAAASATWPTSSKYGGIGLEIKAR
jgi:hypothetical protein